MLKLVLLTRQTTQRFALPFFVVAALAFILMSRTDNPWVIDARTRTLDVLAPVIDVASRPVSAVNAAVDSVNSWLAVAAENEKLRRENARLMHWQAAARQLLAENREFRELLSSVAEPRAAFVTARIIGHSSGTFVRTAVLNAGSRDGVRVGQAVVATHGLVGRITETARHSSRVLLLTDLNSRIPVVFESNRKPAIVSGDNSRVLSLLFTELAGTIDSGERLVTSGEGGMLPPGIPVGIVTGSQGGLPRVTPFVDPARIEHVRVLDYTLPGLMQTTREAGMLEPLW